MKNEEKAKQIADKRIGSKYLEDNINKLEKLIMKQVCLEMAEWKDKQFAQEKQRWFKLQVFYK